MTAITHEGQKALIAKLCDATITSNASIYSAREQLEVPWAARRADLLHAMHYNAPLAHRAPMIVTIHDLTHILDKTLARSWKSRIYARPMLNCVARRADHIITDSHYTRDMIVRHLRVPAEKITVAYLGVDEVFRPLHPEQVRLELKEQCNLSRQFLLFVGNLKPHKNVSVLLDAFSLLIARGYDLELVIVGDDRIGKAAVTKKVAAGKLESRVRIFPHVALQQLVSLYVGAEVVVLPSLEEGFGLPVLEAMACGTPVVCSTSASLPEVGGEAVEYFDPRSPSEIANRVAEVVENDEKRNVMRAQGLARARLFRWDRCARTHFEVYKRFLLN